MSDMKKELETFRSWAISLGCPPEAIPNESGFKAVFKSPQRDLFATLMKRVRPRQEVEKFRVYILLREVKKLGGKDQLMIMPTSRHAFLPLKLQTYWKEEDLKKKHEEVNWRLEEYKKEYDVLKATLKSKNIQVIKGQQRNDALSGKVEVLRLKLKSLEADINKEEGHKTHLIKYMPVKISSKNVNYAETKFAIENAIKALDEFYDIHRNNTNRYSLQNAKENLWSQLRNLFFNLPNCSLFDEILRLKEQQLQNVMALNKNKIDESNSRSNSNKEPMTPFEKELMKVKIDLLGLIVKNDQINQKHKLNEESFCKRFEFFMAEIYNKVCEFNTDESEEQINEVLSDYILQLNSRTYYKAQNEFLQQQINRLRNEIANNGKKLQNHEVLISIAKQTYNDINDTIITVQRDIVQLGQIKQKIAYSRNLLKHKLHDLQIQSLSNDFMTINFGGSKTRMLQSTAPSQVDSFDYGTESMLCSTKLDMDSSIATPITSISTMSKNFTFGDTTLPSNAEARNLLPPHSLELSVFSEIPFEKFSEVEKSCALYISPNPLVIESRELSTTLQLAPGTLLTENAALQEVRNRIAWADSIAYHSKDLKLYLLQNLTMIDVQSYKNRSKIQRDNITELLDKIEVKNIATKQQLIKTEKIYKFSVDNPLRFYIPPTKLWHDQKYSEFESQYKIFYRIATAAKGERTEE